MDVKIGSARIDENGNISGGKAGDQTGKEVSEQSYYTHSRGWVCLRPYDANMASKLSIAMRAACSNENIGYDQSQRTTVITQLKAVGTLGRINTKCEADCSSLVRACVIEAAGKDPGNFNTSTEKTTLLNTKLFFEQKFTFPSELRQGDILVTKTKGHTVIVTQAPKRETYCGLAKITAHSLNIRTGASTNCPIIGWCHRGQQVRIFEEQGTWARIGDGQWVSSKYLEYI